MTGMKGKTRGKNEYSSEDFMISVINTRSTCSKINFVARAIREKTKELNRDSSIINLILEKRLEVYIRLLKMEVGLAITRFTYQMQTVIKEPNPNKYRVGNRPVEV